MKRLQTILMASFLIMPFVAYLACVAWFSVNAPFWDDYPRLLESVNSILQRNTLHEQMYFLLIPHPSGHLPVVTRLIMLGEIQWFGGIHFTHLLIAANIGWIATGLLLCAYLKKQHGVGWRWLAPIPLLMAGITHWEAMDFTLTAWQMYWGGCFLALLTLLALEKRHGFLAAISAMLALFLSGSALALYPIALLYLLYRRRWLSLAAFALPSAIVLPLYLQWSPIARQTSMGTPDMLTLISNALVFIGNLISTGQYDLSALTGVYCGMGLLLMVLGLYGAMKTQGADGLKLLLIYLGALALMAAGGREATAVSRYSMFSVLTAVTVYSLFAMHMHRRSTRPWLPVIAMVIAAGLSIHSYVSCIPLLRQNHHDRSLSIQQFTETGDPAHLLWWDKPRAAGILKDAKDLGIYDYRKAVPATTD
ncbi:MAG TPA: hypothetical protein VIM96_01480 [Pseudomonadales bacterium]